MKPSAYYQVLEIQAGASKDDIKQAYRDLVKVWHPDRFSDDPRLQQKAEEKLKKINAAYEFLKNYTSRDTKNSVESTQKTTEAFLTYERLEKLLELGELQEADYETKNLLLELSGRKKEGWLRPEDVKCLPLASLSAIDELWVKYNKGRFGFSVQAKLWRSLGCISSSEMVVQTISENKFGQAVHWRIGSLWLSPGQPFNYGIDAPKGSLPREYIFVLGGWWSHFRGWTGYLLLRFDDVFLKLK